MSEISTIRGAGALAADTAGRRIAEPAEPGPGRAATRGDSVELSTHARHLAKLSENPIRPDLVAQVRSQIEAGTYESDEKLERAVEALLLDLAGQE